MEIEKSSVAVLDSDGIKKKYQYGIKDPVIVMQTLAGLYSNIQRIIVQEYISNARDAHREVGREDVPVVVTLPMDLDPNLKIRDFGPGLTEERVGEVFCWFGESTKRVDNSQTGGFGIGAKCAFAYTESFMVETYVDGEMRRYVALKDDGETGLPSFNQMGDTVKTNEKNGTCIIIPITEWDFNNIRTWLKRTCQYWDVKPTVTNDTMNWDDNEVVMSGDGWDLITTENDKYYGLRGSPKVILDGIPYDVSGDIYGNLESEYRHVLNLNVLLYFKTGEVLPAVNRESLKVTDKVKETVCERLRIVYNKIKDEVTSQIQDAENLWDANLLWKKMNDELGFRQIVSNVEWNGFKVNENGISAPGDSIVYVYKMREYEEDEKVKSNKENTLKFKDRSLVLINDDNLTRPSPLRIRTILDTEDIDRVQVIQATPAEMLQWKEKGLDHIPTRNISEWEKKKRAKQGKNVSAITSCFECTSKHNRWDSINVDIANDSGVYVEYYRTGPLNENRYKLYDISKKFGVTIYGIPSRYMKKVQKNPNMISYRDFVKAKLDELVSQTNQNDSFLSAETPYLGDYGCLSWLHCHTSIYTHTFKPFLEKVKHLINKDSVFSKWMRLSNVVGRWANRDTVKESKNLFENISMLANVLGVEPKIHNAQKTGYKSKLVEYSKLFDAKIKDNNLFPIIYWSNKINNLEQDECEKLFTMFQDVFNT